MTPVQLDDIPVARVLEAVKALLDLDDLKNVIEVHIDQGAVTAVVYATDAEGYKFFVGSGDTKDIAKHELTRKVVH